MRRVPIHIARRAADDPSQFDILASNDIGYGFVEVAMGLWNIAGRADRAAAIGDLLNSAYLADPSRLEGDHLVRLRDLLDGLEGALIGAVTDEHLLLSTAKVVELRGKTDVLELDADRGELARHAVTEALVYVDHLRTIIDEALQADACLLLE